MKDRLFATIRIASDFAIGFGLVRGSPATVVAGWFGFMFNEVALVITDVVIAFRRDLRRRRTAFPRRVRRKAAWRGYG